MDSMEYDDLHQQLKEKKCNLLDEMWNFTQNYLDASLKNCMECNDELEILEDVENTEEFKSLLEDLKSVKAKLDLLYVDYLKQTCESDLKKEKIITLKEKFGDEISTSEIVTAVNCSKSYARQFYVLDGKVEQKEKRKGLSKKTKNFILKRDNNSCVACGSTETLEIHHIMPIMRSSIKELDEESNLVVLCNNCHYLAHSGNYYKGLAYKDVEDFWKWTKNTERTRIWLILKDIQGIGTKISENIYTKFNSVEELKKADIRTLTRVPLVNKSIANKILFKFRN